MDGLLFDPTEYTDERVRAIMQDKTCRLCAHRITLHQGYDQHVTVTVCDAIPSGRTKSGLLKVKANQPAYILFTNKNNSK